MQPPATISSSALVPISSSRIGNRKTPSAAPNLAQAAAKPWPAARPRRGRPRPEARRWSRSARVHERVEDREAVGGDVHQEPGHRSEDRPPAQLLSEQPRLDQRPQALRGRLRALAVGGGDRHRLADQRLTHRPRLLLVAVLRQPARALGRIAAQVDDHQRRDDAEAEHQPPRVDLGEGVEDDHPDERAEQDADRRQAEGADQPAAAVARRQHLGEVAGGDRVIEPDRDPEHEPERDQPTRSPGRSRRAARRRRTARGRT
jgi:hypothetical protein